ncbi:MAG: NADH-quinone oxidoreductase subunit N [Planctomycetota bacterium]
MNPALVWVILPECILVVAAVGIYLVGAFVEGWSRWSAAAIAAIVVAGVALGTQSQVPAPGGGIDLGPLAWYTRWLALGIGALLTFVAARPTGPLGTAEYAGTLLLGVAGVMLVGSANDLVLLFVGLELISIPTYILLYLGRRDAAAQEAAAKYFYLSILSSAILLYGFSYLYGLSRSTDLAAIAAAMQDIDSLPSGFEQFARLGLALILGGLAFKLTAVPMHFYAPDVYQGTTQTNAALLAVVPKVAGFVAILRLTAVAMPCMAPWAWKAALAMAVLSMTVGNFMALWQQNIRRLMAYSSIAHTGYMLIGLTVGLATLGHARTWDGFAALLFYLAVYAAATIGVFAALRYLDRGGQQIDGVDELAGLARTQPATAGVLAICLFSLAGIPPMAGFWGKLLLFGSALEVHGGPGPSVRPWLIALAVIGGLNAAVAAAYYLRVISVMYFRTPLATQRGEGGPGAAFAALAAALLVLAIGLYPGPLMRLAEQASPAGPVAAAALDGVVPVGRP